MNAHALLTSQGWRGTGHSLHHSSDTIGLSRPLLVSKKDNVLGVGKKQHKTSDMWWMNAFDASLKGLDTSKEGQIKVQEGGGLEMVVKGGSKWVGGKGGLYSFVRGETVGEQLRIRRRRLWK
ncbi:5b26a05c-924b-4996-985a-563271f76093 [Sclerotinia trifoliorum]|uniref:5b26a05c-924b-4996-985a-563271f76093 n=1 Tax=Sclerotinia trifoliorum TaxID=28548 RepID=A0A8H2VNI2_9HELO|nr:5b26a05c-924b-4996-985a-563271f76093 [Sclerotinia trifoliorum]